MTVLDLITQAMKAIGVISSSETPSADEASDGLFVLNGMLDSWNTERLSIYTINAAVYDLVPQQLKYTIGPVGADFTAPRPVRIQNANIILNDNVPPVRVPITLLDDDQWSAISLQLVPSTIPQKLYNDGSFPNSNLYLWGQPSSGLQLELYTWSQITGFTDYTDDFTLPPGYQEAVLYNLAVRLALTFGSAAVSSLSVISPLAQAAKARIQSLNCVTPVMSADQGIMGTNRASTFNIFTGQ